MLPGQHEVRVLALKMLGLAAEMYRETWCASPDAVACCAEDGCFVRMAAANKTNNISELVNVND